MDQAAGRVTVGESVLEVLSDIIYHPEVSHPKVALDVYKPKEKSADKCPILLFAHGGGWQRGDKRVEWLGKNINVAFARAVAERGIVVVSINYRLSRIPHIYRSPVLAGIIGIAFFILYILVNLLFHLIWHGALPLFDPMGWLWVLLGLYGLGVMISWGMNAYVESRHQKERVSHPTQVLDLAHAYKYVVDHAEEWGGDPASIYLAGHSAGGHLVSLLALNPSYLEKAGYSSDLMRNVKGVITLSAVLHLGRLNKHPLPRFFYLVPVFGFDRETYFEASPITYAKEKKRLHFPFLLLNAQQDMHLARDAKEMAELLAESGNSAECRIIPHTNHRSIVGHAGTPKDGITELITEFINKHKAGSTHAAVETIIVEKIDAHDHPDQGDKKKK